MRSRVYLFVVLGTSPAVFTELVWALMRQEQVYPTGIEVWTTEKGADRLRERLVEGSWEELDNALGALPPLLPKGTAPNVQSGLRIHVFEDGGVPLTDVRSEREARVVNAFLYERVRAVRQEVPEDIPIIGSLAGGRKTFSAALQTAFVLQAGLSDRLVHVLLNAPFEDWLRHKKVLAHFAFPTPAWAEKSGVPIGEQVLVYDVPFPRVRWIVPGKLRSSIDEKSWEEVWPVLHQNLRRKFSVKLTRIGISSWIYQIFDADTEEEVVAVPLKRRLGALLAAIGALGDKATQQSLIQWLDRNDVDWKTPTAHQTDKASRPNDISKAANELRKRLRVLPPGLEDFSLPDHGYLMHPFEVDTRWPKP